MDTEIRRHEVRKIKVLISGGTGSFGRAFVERVLKDGLAERLVVLSRDEHKQAAMQAAFADAKPLRFFLGDVRDRARLIRAMQGCDTVVHAAALKIIQQGLYNPGELLATNVIGTKNVLEAAIDAGVARVLVISTDKSVHAASPYGASKALAEFLAIAWNAYSFPRGCRIGVVRYGNVLGSRGSVVHRWRAQVRRGVPLTMTDPAMTRFWITLDQGVAFVLECLGLLRGGEIFVPRLPSLTLANLALALAPEHPVEVTGAQPGEKRHELLVAPEEVPRVVGFGGGEGHLQGFWIVEPAQLAWNRPAWTGDPPDIPAWGYRSDTNPDWLEPDQIRRMLAEVPEEP